MSNDDPAGWQGDAPSFIDDLRLAVRPASMAHYPAVASFTADTWGEGSDYVPSAYPGWMDDEGADQRTFVAVDTEAAPPTPEGVDAVADDAVEEIPDQPAGRAVGVCQAITLSAHEGWVQAMRIHPDYRERGLAVALNDAAFYWLAERGRTTARNMVYSWNTGGLAGSRAAGFAPGTEFRWIHPRPDAEAGPVSPGVEDVSPPQQADAVWEFWQGSDARERLRGLSLDSDERWALSELTRGELREAAVDDRLQVVSSEGPARSAGSNHGVRGFAYRVRTIERAGDDGEQETRAQYGVATWANYDACERLLAAVARDAAAVGADRTRVLVPEGVEWVSDAAAAGADIDDDPAFVLRADLPGAR